MADSAGGVSAVVVTYNGLPWVEQCLDALHGVDTVVVDHGSSDGTVAFVRGRFPEVRVVEQENVALCAGWNRGLMETAGEYVLILNSDAWLVGDGLDALVAVAARLPRAAWVAPRLLYRDGTLQRSVRGFPTLWRLATEYFFLRKLAPRSRALNAFYAAGFDHASERAVEWTMGSCMLVRRTAFEDVGPFDTDFFLFSEETDWCRRAADRGWEIVFTPAAECVHVGGATHGGRLFRENVRGHLRYLAKHEGAGTAERARRLLWASLKLRGVLFRGERGAQYRDVAAWLGSGDVPSLLESSRRDAGRTGPAPTA
jgi:N-acetylglucosaminyl-diphospho-decaprenol L-rhamnosyltransferase